MCKGTDKGGAIYISEAECKSRCLADAKCEGYAYFFGRDDNNVRAHCRPLNAVPGLGGASQGWKTFTKVCKGHKEGSLGKEKANSKEQCKERCADQSGCSRAIYNSRTRECLLDKLDAPPEQCNSDRNYWSYWKVENSAKSLLQVSEDDTMEDVAEENFELTDTVNEVQDYEDRMSSLEDLEDQMCEGSTPEDTQFAAEYLREMGYSWSNISLMLSGTTGLRGQDAQENVLTSLRNGRTVQKHQQSAR